MSWGILPMLTQGQAQCPPSKCVHTCGRLCLCLRVYACTPALSEGLSGKNSVWATYPSEGNNSISRATGLSSLFLGFLTRAMGIMGVTTSSGCCEVNAIKHLRQYFVHSRHSLNVSSCYHYCHSYLRGVFSSPEPDPVVGTLAKCVPEGALPGDRRGPGGSRTGEEEARRCRGCLQLVPQGTLECQLQLRAISPHQRLGS